MSANDYQQPEMAGLDIRDDTLRRDQWQRATCLECGREFLHLAAYKPTTCQRLECSLKARERERAADMEAKINNLKGPGK